MKGSCQPRCNGLRRYSSYGYRHGILLSDSWMESTCGTSIPIIGHVPQPLGCGRRSLRGLFDSGFDFYSGRGRPTGSSRDPNTWDYSSPLPWGRPLPAHSRLSPRPLAPSGGRQCGYYCFGGTATTGERTKSVANSASLRPDPAFSEVAHGAIQRAPIRLIRDDLDV